MKASSHRGTLMVMAVAAVALALAGPLMAASITFQVEEDEFAAGNAVCYPDGEILVPAAVALKVFDGVGSQDAVLKSVALTVNGTTVTFFSDKNKALINGEDIDCDHAPKGVGTAMLIPVGYAAEIVGAKLSRVSPTKVVVEREAFAPRRSADPVTLVITVDGIPRTPKVWRSLPTFDKLNVGATDLAIMLGAKLKWDPDLKAAIFTIDTRNVIFFQDKIHAMLDGQPVALSRVPIMTQDGLLIPLDDTCQMLGRTLVQKTMWSFVVGAE